MATRASAPRAPKNKVVLDLDTLEREGAILEPFVINVKGRALTLLDVQELDWQDLAAIARSKDPHLFFVKAIDSDDYEHFIAAKIPSWKMERLMQTYLDHFGIDEDLLGNSRG